MKVVGMIVPPADGAVPPEPPVLYPDLKFIARGMSLPELTPEGYDSVIGHTADLACQLKADGAEAISLMGTSLSFYRGPAGNAQVLEAMRSATGLPVTTMTDSVVAALRLFGARRLAVATAYTEVVNTRLRNYLAHEGFEVLSLLSLELTDVAAIQATPTEDLVSLGVNAAQEAENPDALFISCGGLRTLPAILPLEHQTGLTAISSATAGAWSAARLVGHSGRAPGYGRLFEMPE